MYPRMPLSRVLAGLEKDWVRTQARPGQDEGGKEVILWQYQTHAVLDTPGEATHRGTSIQLRLRGRVAKPHDRYQVLR
jgi:hypothetical protein